MSKTFVCIAKCSYHYTYVSTIAMSNFKMLSYSSGSSHDVAVYLSHYIHMYIKHIANCYVLLTHQFCNLAMYICYVVYYIIIHTL